MTDKTLTQRNGKNPNFLLIFFFSFLGILFVKLQSLFYFFNLLNTCCDVTLNTNIFANYLVHFFVARNTANKNV